MSAVFDRIKNAYMREYEENPVFTLFMTVLSVFLVILLVAGLLTGGKSILGFLFWNTDQVFMDYFTSIMFSYNDPYTGWHVVYPPLATVFYAVIGHFTVPFADPSAFPDLSFALRNSQMGLMSYFAITFIAICAFHFVLSKLTSNKEIRIRTELFFLLLVFSYPFLTAIERGNNIILVLVFCFIFLMGYRSENRIVRYISYIALGCAAGFKLYPAILGLLVLRERNLKEILICGAIGVILVLFPFVFTDGNISILLENLGIHSSANPYGFVNISQITNNVLRYLVPGISLDLTNTIGTVLSVAVMILSLIVVVFDREMKFWKVLTLLACNLIIGPGVGTSYIYIYILIPIVYFMMSEKKMTRENLLFLICFSLIVAVFAGFEYGGEWVTLASIKSIFVMIMTAVLVYEGFSRIYRNFKNRPSLSAETAA